MYLASLNVDVLLYLIDFIDPVDRFNLALSGILLGLENVNKGMDLKRRYEFWQLELGLPRNGTNELEIRSLFYKDPVANRQRFHFFDLTATKILKQLVVNGALNNNRSLAVLATIDNSPKLIQATCSMKYLEKLVLVDGDLALEDLAHLFQSCRKLTELRLKPFETYDREIDQHVKKPLKRGFQRLKVCEIHFFIDHFSWPVLQDLVRWLKKCVQLILVNLSKIGRNLIKIDGSLTLNPDLAQHLQILSFKGIPVELFTWIFPVCGSVHTLTLDIAEPTNGLHDKISCLKKLKELNISTKVASDLEQFFRTCRQVEKIQVFASFVNVQDIADFKPAENITEIKLIWEEGPSIEEVLPILKRWRHLRQLTLQSGPSVPQFEMLCDFIVGMKYLTYLNFIPGLKDSDRSQLESLREKVTKFALTNRPGFKFDTCDISPSSSPFCSN